MTMIIAAAFPFESFAASGVDLSRIKFSSGAEPLEFSFGTISMEGEVRQEYPFTQAEIKGIVKEALAAKGLTELDIIEANKKVEKARRASEFTKADVERIKENLFTTAGVVPEAQNALTVIQVIDTYMKSNSWDDVGTASAALLEENTSSWVKETAGGFVDRAGELGQNVNKAAEWNGKLTAIVKFCDMMMEEQARKEKKWSDIADGANAKRLLDGFYEVLQQHIEAYKKKSEATGWVIDFNQAMDGRNFKFFGVDSNYQNWYLDIHMVQKTTNELGSVAGEYEGTFTLTAENYLSEFASRAHEAVPNMPMLAETVNSLKADGFVVNLSTSSKGKAYISRTISGSCNATIDPSGDIKFSHSVDKDETQVDISGIAISMSLQAPTAVISSGGEFVFKFAATDEDLRIVNGTATLTAAAPGFRYSENHKGDGSISVGWDEDIWEPWEKGEKTLKHKD
jgi:hypothetical protein